MTQSNVSVDHAPLQSYDLPIVLKQVKLFIYCSRRERYFTHAFFLDVMK